jgi:DNA-binding Lrp family transcriptional regulator
MDAIDEKLLLALRENGRASTAQLARLVGRSRTSVQSRIERLSWDMASGWRRNTASAPCARM